MIKNLLLIKIEMITFNYTKPNTFVLIASKILLLMIALEEYSGRYSLDIQVLAVGN